MFLEKIVQKNLRLDKTTSEMSLNVIKSFLDTFLANMAGNELFHEFFAHVHCGGSFFSDLKIASR